MRLVRLHLLTLLPLVLAALACTSATSAGGPDAGPDAGPPDAGPAPAPAPYVYTAPPPGAVPAGLEPATWLGHLENDLLPYWRMDAAKGTPAGNFPTWRRMDGAPATNTARKPRMMGRQTFAYSIGFLLTGDEALLDLARAGNRFLLDHAWDAARGGWYADLDSNGAPAGDGPKFAQDFAYTAMGPAAYFYVTRDPGAEAAVLATRDLLFDPARYWDAANGRIKDGLNGALTAEAYMNPGGAGSWQLVAQLDPITAFLLLVQPQLTSPARRDQALGDLRTLAALLEKSFFQDGFFFGSTGDLGRFGTQHTDFGHMLKTHWALTQINKRLDDHPFEEFIARHTAPTLRMAHDDARGRWGKAPTSNTTVQYGSDWWAYAECDQLAATLGLHDPSWIPLVAESSGHFRSDYVDTTRPARELVSSVGADGSWVYPWLDGDTAKCNEWKSGFHSTEHALVMNLFSHWASNTPAPLYFAFPSARVDALAADARPYTFLGRVALVEDLGTLAGDATRHKVRVSFDQLR